MTVKGLPESKLYKDGGCRYHPNCLSCPYSRCLLETRLNSETIERRKQVQELKGRGFSIERIATRLGVSRRTITRDIQALKNGI